MKTWISLLVLFIAFSACGSLKNKPSSVDAQLNDKVWSLTGFKGHALDLSDFANGLPSIVFAMQDSKITGNDGCNTFIGVAHYRGNSISCGAIASTKMACKGKDISNEFYEILASKNLNWKLDGSNTLRLYDGDLEMMVLKQKE